MSLANSNEQAKPPPASKNSSQAFNVISRVVDRRKQSSLLFAFSLFRVQTLLSAGALKSQQQTLRRIARLNLVLSKYSDKSLAASTVFTRRAFFRWLVRAFPHFARNCIEKLILSVGIKKEVSIWRLMRLRDLEFYKKKEKFLEFVEKLVELTSQANSKITHSYKNLFFFSLLLISARKEREEFNKRVFGFVRTANGRLMGKASNFASEVFQGNPKQKFIALLQKSALKKEQASFNRLQLLAKKARIVSSFKFIELINEKMAKKAKFALEPSLLVKRRLLRTTIEKINAVVRRRLRQLANRSLILLNQKEGVARFAEIINRAILKQAKREAVKKINLRSEVRQRVENLGIKMQKVEKIQIKRNLKTILDLLRKKILIILENRKRRLCKKLVKKFKAKLKNVFELLHLKFEKSKRIINFITKRLNFAFNQKLVLSFSSLTLMNSVKSFSHAKEIKNRKMINFLNALKIAKKSKLNISFEKFQKNYSQFLIKKEKLKKLFSKISLSFSKTAFKSIKLFGERKFSKSAIYSNKFNFLRLKLAKLLAKKLDLIFKAIQKISKNKKYFISTFEKLTNNLNFLNLKFAFSNVKLFSLERFLSKQKAQIKNQLKNAIIAKLSFNYTVKKRLAFHKFLAHQKNNKNKLRKILFFLKQKSSEKIRSYFSLLKQNRLFYALTNSKDRRKFRLIFLIEIIGRAEISRKIGFVRFLQKNNQREFFSRQILKKSLASKFRQLIASNFHKMIEIFRKARLNELNQAYNKNKIELAELNQNLRPKYKKKTLKNALYFSLLPKSKYQIRIYFARLKNFNSKLKFSKEKIIDLLMKNYKEQVKKVYQKLKTNKNILRQNYFQWNFKLWSIEKMIKAKNNFEKFFVVKKILQQLQIKSFLNSFLNNLNIKQTKKKSVFAFFKLRSFCLMKKTEIKSATQKQNSIQAINQISKAFASNFRTSGKSFFEKSTQKILNRSKFKRFLLKQYKNLLENAFKNLLFAQKEKLIILNRNKENSTCKDKFFRQLLFSSKQKQRQIIQALLKIIFQKQLKIFEDKTLKMIILKRRSTFLKSIFEVAKKISQSRKIKKIKSALLSKFLNAVNRNISKFLIRLRFSSKIIAFKKIGLLQKLKFSQNRKNSLSIKKLKQLLFSAFSKKIHAIRLSNSIEKIFGFKIALLQIIFFSKLHEVDRRRESGRRKTLIQIERMSFRKKAGAFLSKLTEKELIAKERLKILYEIRKATEAKVLQVFVKFQALEIKERIKRQKMIGRIILPLLQSLKQKQKNILSLLFKKVKPLNSSEKLLVLLSFNLNAKRNNAFRFLRQNALEISKNSKLLLKHILKILQTKTRIHLKTSLFNLQNFSNSKLKNSKFGCLIVQRKIFQKLRLALLKLKNPDFIKNQKQFAFLLIASKISGSLFSRQKYFFSEVKKLSPVFLFRTWEEIFSKINKIFTSSKLTPFLLILQKSNKSPGRKLYEPNILTAARTIFLSLVRKNSPDPAFLLLPCFLALLEHAKSGRLDPVQKARLSSLFSQLISSSQSNQLEGLQLIAKRNQLIDQAISDSKDRGFLLSDTRLLLEKATFLRAANDQLALEKGGLAEDHKALESSLAALLERQRVLEQNASENLSDLQALEREQRQLEDSLGQLNQQEERGRAQPQSHPSFKNRFRRLSKEKRDLEGLLSQYAFETKNMESELTRFESEERNFLEKIKGLQGEHAILRGQLLETETAQNRLADENKRLRESNGQILGQIDSLGKEAQRVAEQLRALEEEDRAIKAREATLKEENSSLQSQRAQLAEQNAELLKTQRSLLAEREELLGRNDSLRAQTEDLERQREVLLTEKASLSDAEDGLRRQISERSESRSRLLEDNQYLFGQRSAQLQGQDELLRQAGAQPGRSQRKSIMVSERLGSVFLKLKLIDENISTNNQQIFSEEREIQRAEGELREKSSGLAHAEKQLRQLESRLGELQGSLQENEGRVGQLASEILLGGEEIARNNAQIEANGQLVGENQALISEIERTLRELRWSQTEKGESLGRTRKDIADLNYSLGANAARLDSAKREDSEAAEAQKILAQSILEGEEKIRAMEAKRDELAAKIASLAAESESARTRKKMTKSQIGEKDQGLETLVAEEPEGEGQRALDQTNLDARQELTRRMAELRENLERAGRALEEKKALFGESQKRLSKTQLKIDDKKRIVSQTAGKLDDLQGQIELNLRQLDQQAEKVRQNEAELKSKESQIERNQAEIRALSEKLAQALKPQKAPFLSFKRVESRKVQTSAVESNEGRTQTELCAFDVRNLEKRAAQKHVVRTLEPRKSSRPGVRTTERGVDPRPDVSVQYFAKEQPKSFVIEESIAPVVLRVRQMRREPSTENSELPATAPEDPMNFPLLAKDRHLDKIAKLYEERFETQAEERDVIGMLKRNPFMKIDLPFGRKTKADEKLRGEKRVASITSYFVKGTEQGPPTPLAKERRDILVETDLIGLGVDEQAMSAFVKIEAFQTKRAILAGPAFAQAKKRRQEYSNTKVQIDVFGLLYPKNEQKILEPLPLVRELTKMGEQIIKETVTNATQTESDPLILLGLAKLTGIENRWRSRDLQAALSLAKERTWPFRKPTSISFSALLPIFNSKSLQQTYQQNLKRKQKIDSAEKLAKTIFTLVKRHLKNNFNQLRFVSQIELSKLYLNSLFKWKLQNIDFNHQKQLERIKSLRIGLDSIFSRLIYKRLGLAFRCIQRNQDLQHKAVYKKIFPIIFKANSAYEQNLKNVLRYWLQIKDENRWFTKIVRNLVYKSSLDPQVALWRLRFFRSNTQAVAPNFAPGFGKLQRIVRARNQRMVKECARVFLSLVRLRTPEDSGSERESVLEQSGSENYESADSAEKEEALSQTNAKFIVLSIRSIFRTLEDRWRARKISVFGKLRQLTSEISEKRTKVKSNGFAAEKNADFLIEQNFLCKRELEKKEKLVDELRQNLDEAKQNMVFLKNNFIYIVLNRIQRFLKNHAKRVEIPLKRSAFSAIRRNSGLA